MSPDASFDSPWGALSVAYRADTCDWNNVYSCLVENEYAIPGGMTGWALDIGAHIGGATLALLASSPGLRVVAVEPLPENAALLRENVARNGFADRCIVLEGAVSTDTILYDFAGEGGPHHRYIGNAWGPAWSAQSRVTVKTYDLDDLRLASGADEFAFAKVDCEGGEWGFFGPACAAIRTIAGEWHPVDGHVQSDVTDALPDFAVTFDGPVAGPGGFRAVRSF